MRHQLVSRVLPVAIAVTALVVACDQPPSNTPTGPSAPGVSAIEITGPATVAPGQSTQLGAAMRLADGSVKIASPGTVRWRSSNTFVANISANGLITAGGTMGEVVITAETNVGSSLRRSTREIVVVPDGTFRVVGTVTEVDPPNPSIPGARVEVTTGSPFAITDFNGQYRLYGVPPSADLRASAPGYSTDTRTVQLTGHATQNFQLALTGPRPSLAGNYTVSIDVVQPCTSPPTLPSDLQHRSYAAVMTQNGSTLDVALIEPRFVTNGIGKGNHFSGQIVGAGARFTLDWYDSYYYPFYGPSGFPSVAERLSNATVLVPQGLVTVTGSSAGLSGTLSGSLALWDTRFPTNSNYLGACYGNLQFKMDPR